MKSRFAVLALACVVGSAFGPLPAYADNPMAQSAKISISQAVDAAEKKGLGKATEVDFGTENGGRWEVKVVADGGNKLTEYYVDSKSGQVTGQEEQTFEKYFTTLKPESFAQAPTQLKAAIAAAEAFAKGKAIDAAVSRDSDAVSYEISVVTPAGEKDVNVDAAGHATAD